MNKETITNEDYNSIFKSITNMQRIFAIYWFKWIKIELEQQVYSDYEFPDMLLWIEIKKNLLKEEEPKSYPQPPSMKKEHELDTFTIIDEKGMKSTYLEEPKKNKIELLEMEDRFWLSSWWIEIKPNQANIIQNIKNIASFLNNLPWIK